MKHLKFTLWWFFKAPWVAKYGLLGNVYRFILAKNQKRNNTKLIHVCIACTNRIEMLQKAVLPSINQLKNHDRFKFVFVTSQEEQQTLQNLLHKEIKHIPFHVVGMKTGFTRSSYLNAAIQACTSKWLFLSDSDIALPSHLYKLYTKHVNKKQIWLPVSVLLDEKGEPHKTYDEGTGIIGFYNHTSVQLNEELKTWGNEDWDLVFKLYLTGNFIVRTKKQYFLHHYHPPVSKENYQKLW